MEDLGKIVKEILDQGYLMSLGTYDESGPWVSEVLFVNDGVSLYWLSSVNTRHSKAVVLSHKAAATITLANKLGDKEVGLQIEGKAEKIEGDVFKIAKKHRIKRGKPVPEKEGDILGPNESWYKLTPTKIEIINAPLWGFAKKSLEIK